MTNLLELREYIRIFYGKYEIYVKPVLKFLVALVSFMAINSGLGYMELAGNIGIVLMLALMCSFMPWNFMVFTGAGLVLLHAYALAVECAIVVLALFAVMFLMYFRFSPRDTLVVMLTPILFAWKIPFVMPVAMGLLSGPMSAVSVSCGVVVYYTVKFMTDNAAVFSAGDAETGAQKFRIMMDGILENKAMLVTIIVFILALLTVYMVRRLSIDYAWTIATISGLSVSAVLLLLCEFLMDLQFSVIAILLGSIVSFFLCTVIQFMKFNVDYNRTEIVQFEDDEYYYYVKAVPKNMLTAPEKKVKKINRQHKNVPAKQEKPVTTIKTSHGVSRTTIASQDNKMSKPRQD